MKIIIAPAKKMRNDVDYLSPKQQPVFEKDAKKLLKQLKTCSISEIKRTLKTSDTIAKEAFLMYRMMDFKQAGTPALLAYVSCQVFMASYRHLMQYILIV